MDLASLRNYIEKSHLKKVWLLTWEENTPSPKSSYQNLPPECIYEAMNLLGDSVIGFYAPDPRESNFAERLELWKTKGFKGCGELKVRCKWASEQVKSIVSLSNSLEMPVLFHMEAASKTQTVEDSLILDRAIKILSKINYRLHISRQNRLNISLKVMIENALRSLTSTKTRFKTKTHLHDGYLDDISGLETALKKYPSLKFIGHGPDFWRPIQEEAKSRNTPSKNNRIIRLLSDYENLHADLSARSGYYAMNQNHTYSSVFLNLFQEKILYGTDNFDLGLENLVNNFFINESTKQKIFFRNAERFFIS